MYVFKFDDPKKKSDQFNLLGNMYYCYLILIFRFDTVIIHPKKNLNMLNLYFCYYFDYICIMFKNLLKLEKKKSRLPTRTIWH